MNRRIIVRLYDPGKCKMAFDCDNQKRSDNSNRAPELGLAGAVNLAQVDLTDRGVEALKGVKRHRLAERNLNCL